jgi:hypothetical protein
MTIFGSRACGKCIWRLPMTGRCALWHGKRGTGNLPCPDYQERKKGGERRGESSADQTDLLEDSGREDPARTHEVRDQRP